MKYIGWFVVLIWLTGAVGLIDVSVCIKAFGKCQNVATLTEEMK